MSLPTTLPDWLARRAASHPERPALITGAQRVSFAQLDVLADAAAAHLRALKLEPGAPVALLAGNGPAFAALIHAMPRCGATLTPLNTRLSPEELAWQLEDSGARVLLHDADHAELAAAATAHRPLPLIAVDQAWLAAPPPRRDAEPLIDLAATHTIIYTSGTTGRPKGARLSYANHWWSAGASALNLGLYADDCWLAPLPLFHIGGMAVILRGAIYGISIVLPPRFDPAAINAAIEAERVTIISVVATMLQRMLDERGDHPYPSHLRCVLLGGGPAPRPMLERCAALRLPVVQTYGMTETASQAATLAPADALRKLGSAGRPLLPLELQISVDGRMAAPGEVGEIRVRGPMVISDYHGRAESAALREGWLYTGDLGYLDAEGYLYVVDRRSDLIISGGENVYPAEVEATLSAHPSVADVAVVATADPQWGQTPLAVVVPHSGIVADPALATTLIAYCRERLAGYKTPRRVVFAASLPRTAAGKLQRRRIREQMAGE